MSHENTRVGHNAHILPGELPLIYQGQDIEIEDPHPAHGSSRKQISEEGVTVPSNRSQVNARTA